MTNAILAAEDFDAGRYLAGFEDAFRSECERLPADHFIAYPDRHLHDAGWLICLFLLRWNETPPLLQVPRNRKACPQSTAAAAVRQDMLMAGFSRLMPGCRVVPHRDRPKPGVLRWLTVLRGDGSATITLDHETRPLQTGQHFVLDHSLQHAAANAGTDACDFLTVDFEVPERERVALLASRGGVNLGPTTDTPPSPTS